MQVVVVVALIQLMQADLQAPVALAVAELVVQMQTELLVLLIQAVVVVVQVVMHHIMVVQVVRV
jgi:hypothetical protein